MVQGYYNLKEAADLLGMSVDQLNRMAQKREVRAFADSGSWKFRTQDIEELVRTRQHGSAPDIQLSDLDLPKIESDSDEAVRIDPTGIANPDIDSSATVIGLPSGGARSDSDIRLVPGGTGSGSDSDVRLVVPPMTGGGKSNRDLEATIAGGFASDDIIRPPSDADIQLPDIGSKMGKSDPNLTEELRLEDSVDLSPGLAGSEGGKHITDSDFELSFDEEMPKIEATSDYDLSASDPILSKGKGGKGGKKNVPDSDQTIGIDSDMELSASSDFNLSDFDLSSDSGVRKNMASDSGINLAAPDDSGISLEDKKEASDSEFELSLESDEDIFDTEELPGLKDDEDSSETMVSRPAAKKGKEKVSAEDSGDSDFELAMGDDDLEIEEDAESGSEVIAIDDEDSVEESVDIEAEDDDEIEDVEEGDDDEDEFEDELSPVGAGSGPAPLKRSMSSIGAGAAVAVQSAPWPTWVFFVLTFTTCCLALVGMMMFELMRNAWSYNTPYTMSGTLIEQVHELAKTIGIAK